MYFDFLLACIPGTLDDLILLMQVPLEVVFDA